MADIIDMKELERLRQEVGRVTNQEKKKYGLAEDLIALPIVPDWITSEIIWQAMKNGKGGDADLYARLYKDKFLYDEASECWFVWDEHHWEEDAQRETFAAVRELVPLYEWEYKQQVIRSLEAAKNSGKENTRPGAQAGRLLKRIGSISDPYRMLGILAIASAGKTEDTLGIRGDEWDTDPMVLCCQNGVIDLTNGSIRPGKHNDYIKSWSTVPWIGLETPTPHWEKFIESIFDGDSELIDYVHRLLGYSITGQVAHHILPILYGDGRNGKGVLMAMLEHVLGRLVGPIESELLLEQGKARPSGGPSPDIMSLQGKRLVWASETDEGRKFSAGKVKWLTGADMLVGRPLFGRRMVQFHPTHKLFLLTNSKPRANATDFALWARIRLIPFRISFLDEPEGPNQRKSDPDLAEKLKGESSGILAWLVRGCLEWQSRGLIAPDAVKTATKEYKEDEDIIGTFIVDKCNLGIDMICKAGALYDVYSGWCDENRMKPVGSKSFAQEMKKRFDHFRNNGSWYRGIDIKS